MKSILLPLLLILSMAFAPSNSYTDEITAWQHELNDEYKDPEETPLTKKALRKFSGHPFFPIDSTYRVKALFTIAANPVTFQMKTTTSRLPTYDKYGVATFNLDGQDFVLTLYQSHALREKEGYHDYLFLPFTDLTNGSETYGGGRYISCSIPEGDTITIDFNKAYQPYCAYNPAYSCPKVPAENHMDIRVEAGVKDLDMLK